jgi:hypothetical protein
MPTWSQRWHNRRLRWLQTANGVPVAVVYPAAATGAARRLRVTMTSMPMTASGRHRFASGHRRQAVGDGALCSDKARSTGPGVLCTSAICEDVRSSIPLTSTGYPRRLHEGGIATAPKVNTPVVMRPGELASVLHFGLELTQPPSSLRDARSDRARGAAGPSLQRRDGGRSRQTDRDACRAAPSPAESARCPER